jgi:hypothetical protein
MSSSILRDQCYLGSPTRGYRYVDIFKTNFAAEIATTYLLLQTLYHNRYITMKRRCINQMLLLTMTPMFPFTRSLKCNEFSCIPHLIAESCTWAKLHTPSMQVLLQSICQFFSKGPIRAQWCSIPGRRRRRRYPIRSIYSKLSNVTHGPRFSSATQ